MKIFKESCFLLLPCILLFSGHSIHASSYNYYATSKCLKEPQRVQYGGGIIVNPQFNHGLDGWAVFGEGRVREGISKEGNRFIVVHNRTQSTDSFSQQIHVEEGKLYTFSAWIQLSQGSGSVSAVFKSSHDKDMIPLGKVIAVNGCWTLLKGGFTANSSSPVQLLFLSRNTKVEIWVDNVSLQPFSKEQWRSHQYQSIEKVRKRKVRFQIAHPNKSALEGVKLSIKQTKAGFPFGCGMNYKILGNKDYQNWFTSRFKFTTFTNEMKWYSTEKIKGQENYTLADSMVKFAKQNDISIRGHNIFWDNPKYQPEWVKSLPPQELKEAAQKRINSVVSRYAGELIAWDVMNENLHFDFFEEKLGENASSEYFSTSYKIDPNLSLFMNEYNTIEYSKDEESNPSNYKRRLEGILAFPGNGGISAGIGLQGHFGAGQPDLAYMRAALDVLGAMGLPIWLTEVDVAKDPNQAQYYEEVLREGYSHPGVEGIITFAGPEVAGFTVMPLVDTNFKNTPAGDVIDKLLEEWSSSTVLLPTDHRPETASDSSGYAEVSLFHGDYSVDVLHPITNSSMTTFVVNVTKHVPLETVLVQIHA